MKTYCEPTKYMCGGRKGCRIALDCGSKGPESSWYWSHELCPVRPHFRIESNSKLGLKRDVDILFLETWRKQKYIERKGEGSAGLGHSFALWQRGLLFPRTDLQKGGGPFQITLKTGVSSLSCKSCCGRVSSSTQRTKKNT